MIVLPLMMAWLIAAPTTPPAGPLRPKRVLGAAPVGMVHEKPVGARAVRKPPAKKKPRLKTLTKTEPIPIAPPPQPAPVKPPVEAVLAAPEVKPPVEAVLAAPILALPAVPISRAMLPEPPDLWVLRGRVGSSMERWIPDFVKGQFSQPGMTQLISRFNHITQGFGAAYLDSSLYAVITPAAAWYFKDWSFAVHVPLRLLAFAPDISNLEFAGMKLRREDWDEVSDYFKVIRFLTYGRQEDRLYASINTLRPLSLGHEQLFTRYQSGFDRDRTLTSFQFEWYNDYVGTQLLLNDITFTGGRVLGALAFLKPGAFFKTKNVMLNSLSLGVEYGGDLAAPKCIRRNMNGDDSCVQGSGNLAAVDPVTSFDTDTTYVRATSNRRFAVDTGQVHAVGTSLEMKVLRFQNKADLKVYGTFHKFLNQGGGMGGAMGLLGRFNTTSRGEWIHAFRLRTEYRVFGDGYLPGYFDTNYEVSKYEYGVGDPQFQATPTRYQRVFGDPANGFNRPSFGTRHGYRAELQYGLFLNNRQNKKFALSVGVEDSTGPYDTGTFLHVDFPMLGWLQFFATYMRVKGESFAGLYSKGGYYGGDIYIAGLRAQILWVAFLNIRYMRSGQIIGGAGSEYHVGNHTIPDRFGNPAGANPTGLFLPASALFIDMEFGWEADDGFHLFKRMKNAPKKS